jgi:hypothetical protein
VKSLKTSNNKGDNFKVENGGIYKIFEDDHLQLALYTIYRLGFSLCLKLFFSEPSSVKILFSLEDSKKLFSFHVEQKYIFP